MCGPDEEDNVDIGNGLDIKTATECALKCKATENCRFFSYGRWDERDRGLCFHAKTPSGDCPKGFKPRANVDFYAMPGNIYSI